MEFNNEGLYSQLLTATGATPLTTGGKTQASMPCPYCHAGSYSDMRFSFGNVFDEAYGGWGFHCFVCNESGSMFLLASIIGAEFSTTEYEYIPQVSLKKEQTYSYTWMDHVEELVVAYQADERRYQYWYDYKGLTHDAVDDWELGVGVLPETRFNETRLITPIHSHSGNVEWLRGRLPQGQKGTAWVGAGGIKPTQIELAMGWTIQPGKPLFVFENYVDALIVNHYLRDKYSAVPTFSVAYWSDDWTKEIVARKPSQVIVAFDPDLAGNGPVDMPHAALLFKERISKLDDVPSEQIVIKNLVKQDRRWTVNYATPAGTGVLRLPKPFGMQRAEALLEQGIPAKTAKWTDYKKDIGDFLADELKKRDRS